MNNENNDNFIKKSTDNYNEKLENNSFVDFLKNSNISFKPISEEIRKPVSPEFIKNFTRAVNNIANKESILNNVRSLRDDKTIDNNNKKLDI